MNAIYSGPFITKAKAEFSNSQNANMQKWSSYIKGDPKRQEILAEALEWVSSAEGISVDAYLAKHRGDTDITGLKTYFTSVIDWIGSVFTRPPDKEMRGLDWGRLYESYHSNSYNAAAIDADVDGSAPTQRCRTTRASTSICWVGRRTRSCSTSGCSTRGPRVPRTSSRRRRRRGGRVELPAVRDRQRRQQDAHLQAGRDGRRPRDGLVEGGSVGP